MRSSIENKHRKNALSLLRKSVEKVALIVPTLNRYDLLQKLLGSVQRGTKIPQQIIVIDNGGECPNIPNATVVRPGRNLGVAASWNLGLRMAEGPAIVSNDDVVARVNTVENILEHGKKYSLVGCTFQFFSFFFQKPDLVTKVGEYDEKFWPAYCEDVDFLQRVAVAGVPYLCAKNVILDRPDGLGNTFKKLDPKTCHELSLGVTKNYEYFVKKWGDSPHHERFQILFRPK